jgi:hypothetical protein
MSISHRHSICSRLNEVLHIQRQHYLRRKIVEIAEARKAYGTHRAYKIDKT